MQGKKRNGRVDRLAGLVSQCGTYLLYAAEEQGYFAEEGLKVKLQMPADTTDALKLVATGKADLALSYQMQVALARSEQIPVVSVGAIVRHPLNQLFVPEASGIKSPKDLIGKKSVIHLHRWMKRLLTRWCRRTEAIRRN